MTRGTANPESVTDRPNKVSVGALLWARIATAKMKGATTQHASTRRTLCCATSFVAPPSGREKAAEAHHGAGCSPVAAPAPSREAVPR